MNSIFLLYPGGELCLHKYKRRMPPELVTRKIVDIAGSLFPHWDWIKDPEIHGVEHNDLLLIALPNREVECYL